MRRRVVGLAGAIRRAWWDHCSALAVVPDPHGQFPGLPLAWYATGEPAAHQGIPEQRLGSSTAPADRRR